MYRRLIAVTTAALALFVCGQRVDPEDASPEQQAYTASSAATGYNPATDVWWTGHKIRTRTLCIETHGKAAVWPWNTVAWGYYRAGIYLYPRPAGGCAAFPDDKKVIVRTYSKDDRMGAYTLVWRVNPKTGRQDGPLMQRAEIWLNLHSSARALRTGRTFPSVVAHEVGHVLGFTHTTHPQSIMHGDWVFAQWVDVQRLRGLYWKTPAR